MGKEKHNDPVMEAVRKRFADSKMTQVELGEKMGYARSVASQAVSQFLKSGDPQISMLRRFAKAMGISIHTLLK